MVIKGEKPTEVTLADGPILTTELAEVLRTAWPDTDDDWPLFNWVSIHWDSGHEATVRNLDKLEPIEDAENVSTVYGSFRYSDKSELTLNIRPYSGNTVTAKGSIARSKASEIAQRWAGLPDRAKVKAPIPSALWVVGYLLIGLMIYGTTYNHFVTRLPVTPLDWLYTAGWFLTGVALVLFARSTATLRARRQPVVYRRKRIDPQHVWAAVTAIGGIGVFVVAMLTWLYPRN
jgi:hypothetical protein